MGCLQKMIINRLTSELDEYQPVESAACRKVFHQSIIIEEQGKVRIDFRNTQLIKNIYEQATGTVKFTNLTIVSQSLKELYRWIYCYQNYWFLNWMDFQETRLFRKKGKRWLKKIKSFEVHRRQLKSSQTHHVKTSMNLNKAKIMSLQDFRMIINETKNW